MIVVIHPGYVISKNDGDLCKITASDLKRLYGVRETDTVFIDPHGMSIKQFNQAIHLYPRFDGQYYDIHKHPDLLTLKEM